MEKVKVLIVEDEIIIAMQIRDSLLSLGYHVTSIVDSGEKAIKKTEEDKPDLILMDIRIKGEMDGIAVAGIIGTHFHIPIVFITAFMDENRQELSNLTIPFSYLFKPVQELNLRVTLEITLQAGKIDAKRRLAEEALLENTRTLNQRLKELKCLYDISMLVEKPDISQEEIFQGAVDHIQLAWQYTDITCVRLVKGDLEFSSRNFRETHWKQVSNIIVDGQIQGRLEVFYLEEKPDEDEGPFLKEERNLIDSISQKLGGVIKRKQTEERLKIHDQQLIQADKMISLGILVSGVAHEINNPNHAIASNVSPLKKIWDDVIPILNEYQKQVGEFEIAGLKYSNACEQVQDIFKNITKSSNRIRNIVHELGIFSRAQPLIYYETIQLNNIVISALTLLQSMTRKSTKYLSQKLATDLPLIKGNFQQLEQVAINLIQNACQSLTNREERITISTFYDHQQAVVGLKIVDEGCGIPAESLKRITDPFFTLKRDIGCIGLGLAISSKLILEHHGRLQFMPGLKKGTIATVLLPVILEE